MASRKIEARIIEWFDTAPLEQAVLVLNVVKARVKARTPQRKAKAKVTTATPGTHAPYMLGVSGTEQ